MQILNTERLVLRTWKSKDLAPMTAINQDPLVMRYFPALQSEAETADFINRANQHQQQYGFSCYAVALASKGTLIGQLGIMHVTLAVSFVPAIEIGWRLAAQYWGAGYATEAASAVVEYAFTTLGLPELVAFTANQNQPSRRVMEKIGMQHCPDEDFNHPSLIAGHPLERHVYGL